VQDDIGVIGRRKDCGPEKRRAAVVSASLDKRIGIVGVGNMGIGIAESIVRGGFDLMAYDISEKKLEEVAALGAKTTTSLPELAASSDVVCVVVLNDAQVRAVGETIADNAKPGTSVLIHSTVRPATIIDLSEYAAEKNVGVLDVSVSGGQEAAKRGTLTLTIGGDEDLARSIWPLLESFGKSILYMGPIGSGVVAKLVNNLIAIGSYALQIEGMRLGSAYGLSEDAMATAIISSQGDSKSIRAWGRMDRKRAIRAEEGDDGTVRPGRELREAALAASARGVTLGITSVISDAMASVLRQRDSELAGSTWSDVRLCSICGQDLAAPFRAAGTHPECRPGYWHVEQ
jgi:3-hydroxyisobutyrate dehydrogenase-like beta-hydroxyacid dehydrogenase